MALATDWKEHIPDGESEKFERYSELFAEVQKRRAAKAGATDCALHAKSNLGVIGEFEVLATAPVETRVGLFATPKTYTAVVRYSNGGSARQSDRRPDVRGIGVKLLGVDGKKVIPGLEDATTQDFLAIRTPKVPVKNADEFVTLVRAAATPALVPFKLIGALGFGRGLSVLREVVRGFKQPMMPLASTAYYTAVPQTYGPYAAQLAFVPHAAGGAPSPSKDANYLGEALAAHLAESAVVYDVKVRFFESEQTTPIEDASVEWTSPLHTVARLTLPKQDVMSAKGRKLSEWIETLSFDPWHARTDLRPLGSMMRARNAAYRVSSQGRKALSEPTSIPE